MANNIEINQLPALGSPQGIDVIPVSRGDSFTKKLTIQQLIDFVAVGGKVISSIEITTTGDIIVHYSDSTVLNAGSFSLNQSQIINLSSDLQNISDDIIALSIAL